MNKPKILTQAMKLLIVLVIIILTIPVITALTSEEAAESPLIRLQYASFDPLQGEPYAPVGGNYQAAADSPATYLLQFSGPVQQDWKATVQAAGARLYGYVPDYAFITRMDGATVQQVVELPYVRWVGLYYPAYRLSNSLLASQTDAQPQTVEVTVETLPDADLQSLSMQIGALGGSVQGQAQNSLSGYLRVNMPADQMEALAALDGVLWVEPYFKPELINDQGGGTIMHAAGIRSALELDGSGQVVGVADSGLDTGNQSTLHPDVSGRVVNEYCLGRPSPCDWSDYVSHGTHVAGSVLGDGTASGGVYSGVAPKAGLVFQSVGDAFGGLAGLPTDRGDLMRQAYGDGARIHTNSWGGPTGQNSSGFTYGGYVSSSQQVDAAMWELMKDPAGAKQILVLFAAGNHGVDTDKDGLINPDSINQPGTAKNVLTVGASENDRPGILNLWGSSYGAPIDNDLRADKPYGMAAFSSRGPTDDGRVKPDIVAPGTYIASLRTRQYVFNDDLEAGTGDYSPAFLYNGGTGSSAWQLRTDDPHSASHYWRETINDNFSAGAITTLLTPEIDVRPTGGYFDVHFWHKYSLSPGDNLAVLIVDTSTNTVIDGKVLFESGTSGAYDLRTVNFGPLSAPSSIRVGFGIQSDGSSNSTWQVDDIRVDGSDWGTLGSVGLANPGDNVDEAYLLMGGTSMATPLTAGATALVREWLVTSRGFANPSGALMKATLINGAADMSPGQYTSPQEVPDLQPNNVSGWGRVDLIGSLNPPLPRQVWLQDNTSGLTTGNSTTYTLTVGAPTALALNSNFTDMQEPASASVAQTASKTPEPPTVSTQPFAPVDKEITSRRVELGLNNQKLENQYTDLLAPNANVSLVLDDGGNEDSIGLTDSENTVAYQFIWLNRFTPSSSEFPFNLEEIQVMFDDLSGVNIGDSIDLVVYHDNDSDPSNGATLLSTIHETVKAVDGVTWSQYTLALPIPINNPGDVLIGVINRYVVDGVSPPSYPATIDESNDQGRSWIGWWVYEPPDPATLPPNYYLGLISELVTGGGNWLIRGYGTTSTVPTPSPPPPDDSSSLRVTLAWTDYPGNPAVIQQLVNNLDLEVIAPDGTTHHYGNAGLYTSAPCLRDSRWDACNNVEGVIIPDAPNGNYRVIVHGYNVPQGPQPFALVASGDNLLGTAGNLKSIFLPLVVH